MKQNVLVVLSLACLNATAGVPLDCKTEQSVAYTATLDGSGNSRVVEVVFNRKPTAVFANKIVTACMQVVINNDTVHELLGSAWIGETQFNLAPGKENLAYFPKERQIMPFGLDDAIKNLKRK